jgi:cytochrome P450
MAIETRSPHFDNALLAPKNWGDETGIHEYFTWMRKHDPIRYVEPDGFFPFWCVTKYEDIKEIEGHRNVFLNEPRMTLAPEAELERIRALTGRKNLFRALPNMDAPDHSKYRMLAQPWFMGQKLRDFEKRVQTLASECVDRLAEHDGECDFVKDVAVWYPLRVIMEILGVPASDEARMLKLTQEVFGSSDPDSRRSLNQEGSFDSIADFNSYFRDFTAERRKHPTNDLGSEIANARVDGELLSELETNSYFVMVATAGHDTTSASSSGGLHALLTHPAEFAALKSDVDDRLPGAIEEIIRWVTPVRHFQRTAAQDYELRGKTIREGEVVTLWYHSANRDEEIFDDPFTFRIERKGPKQLAFGFGPHVCLGQHLARMEMTALFKELMNRVEHIELTAEPQYTQSYFVGGLKSMPIRYRMK